MRGVILSAIGILTVLALIHVWQRATTFKMTQELIELETEYRLLCETKTKLKAEAAKLLSFGFIEKRASTLGLTFRTHRNGE